MTYERKKKFVLDHLFGEDYRLGINIINASNGLLRKSTAYQTFDHMEKENLLVVRGIGRAWEREYSRTLTSFEPWKHK